MLPRGATYLQHTKTNSTLTSFNRNNSHREISTQMCLHQFCVQAQVVTCTKIDFAWMCEEGLFSELVLQLVVFVQFQNHSSVKCTQRKKRTYMTRNIPLMYSCMSSVKLTMHIPTPSREATWEDFCKKIKTVKVAICCYLSRGGAQNCGEN